MINWLRHFTVLACTLMPALLTAGECDFITKKKFSERQALLWEKMETFISHLQPAEYYPSIINGLKKRSPTAGEAGVQNAIWLKDLVPALRKEAEILMTTPKEEKEVILTKLQKEVNDLILTASCYHLKKPQPESPIMMLKLLDQGESTDPLFGFMTTTKEGKPGIGARVTRPSQCKGGHCTFSHITKAEFQKETAVRLIHAPLATRNYTDGLAFEPAVAGELPEETYLTRLNLKITGEWFSDPEMTYSLVCLDEKEEKVFSLGGAIPWATNKGENISGLTLLVPWQRGCVKAKVALIENDVELPTRYMNAIWEVATTLLPAGKLIDEIISNAVDKILEDEEDKEDRTLFDLLSHFQEDDLIDRVVLERTSTPTEYPLPMLKGNATMYLQNLYKKVPTEESRSSQPEEPEEKEEL